ncbi:MAG TPA: bile acid:sodium symporter [Trebonia sp.]|nr:bile acid:sodium symporter [Trebonia sp.]
MRGLLASYTELAAVLAAAIIGLSVQRPLAWLAAGQGINVLLAVLVFATAVTIEPAALRRAAAAWRPLLAALAIGVTVLPALAWAAARLVPAGPLHDGVLTVGLAPCEIASVATTAMAAGEAAVAAGLLIGSTVAAVAVAGPILALEAGHAGFSQGGVIGNLALVVVLPLAVGIALRASARSAADVRAERASRASASPAADVGAERASRAPARPAAGVRAERSPRAPAPPAAGVGAEQAPARISIRAWLPATTRALATPRAQRIASHVALAAVAALVALIAAEVHFSAGYAAVAAALVVFLLGSVVVGRLLGLRAPRPVADALLLTTSMRDFAIAAGLAAAAFGPAAAAPLGLYGILVLVWGTAAAGALRRRAAVPRMTPEPDPRHRE